MRHWHHLIGSAWLRAVLLALLAALPSVSPPSRVEARELDERSQATLRLELVASGLDGAVAYVPDPRTPGVAFVVQQHGLVCIVADGSVRDQPFLDLRDAISSGGERGLLGFAIPIDADSRRVYVNFTDPAGHTVIARFTRDAADPLVAIPESRFDLQWPDGRRFIEQPYSNHNGGHLAFGPDGYLYIGLGDGGAGNDPGNRAQTPTTLLGKMLRIDVNVPDDDGRGYAVPSDNPFVHREGVLGEIWAFGYRNPWRYSFDDLGADATGALLAGDVGQGAREEIDYEPAGAGGRNYGWRQREGTVATPGIPPEPVEFTPFVEPLFDYGRGRGQAVTGGFVYRGAALPAAYAGRYFFADFASGRVWSLSFVVDPVSREATLAEEMEHTDELGGARPGLSSFGRDAAGELYVTTLSGEVYRLAAEK